MLLAKPQFNHLIFQLVKFNTETQKVTEILVNSLVVLPRSISYFYTSRAAITQTRGDKEVVGFVDKFGRGLTRVQIRGVFGTMPRRVGLELKNGWTRLVEFRELVFKLSHILQGQETSENRYMTLAKAGLLQENDIIAVNFFDFINDERFSVNLDQFQINEDVSSNNLPIYVLIMTELGEIIETKTSDPTLSVLLAADKLFSDIVNNINELGDKIYSNSTIQGISKALAYAETALEGVGAGLTTLKGTGRTVLDMADTAKSVYNGTAIDTVSTNLIASVL
jgi:hypothetical protein